MSRKSLTLAVAPVVLALGLAACDTEDYEARVAELEGELETVRGEAETYRTEAEELRAQLEELEAAPAAEGAPAVDVQAVQSEFQAALAALADVDDRLQDATDPVVMEVRQDLQQVAEAIGNVAQDMGVELEAIAPPQPEGAAGTPPPAGQQPAAAPEGTGGAPEVEVEEVEVEPAAPAQQ